MPNYIYRAKDKEGKTAAGVEYFEDEHQLAEILRSRGLILVSAVLATVLKKKRISWGKVSVVERLMFTRNFRVMLNAGLSITRILDILANQTHSRRFALVIREINDKLRQGMGLAEAFAGYPNVFDNLYVSMMKTGESGSSLETVLAALEEQLRRDYELRSRIKSAMVYPVVMISALTGVGGMIVFFVMPRLATAFTGLGAKMPFTLRIFILLDGVMREHWPLVLAALAVLVLGLRFLFKFRGFKQIKDKVILHLPIFGNMSRQVNTARFVRTLSSLIIGGVPIYQGLTITANTLDNQTFRESLQESAAKVQRGTPLNQSLDRELWPPIVMEMTVVGEETGRLSEMLAQLAVFYEEEVSNTVKNISSLIEPILMIVIGSAIGIFAVSVITPIYSIVSSF